MGTDSYLPPTALSVRPTMKKLDGQTVFLGSAILLALAVGLTVLFLGPGTNGGVEPQSPAVSTLTLEQIPVDGRRSYELLKRVSAIGPRFSGSPGMQQQQLLLKEHFEKLGGQVEFQRFLVRHPVNGEPVEMANLIVHWHPESKQRVLVCAHYDTRPFPDRDPDPRARRGIFIGANDGASGVAVLGELAHWMSTTEFPLGIDFVLFDGEELVYDEDRDRYFLGSQYFSQDYVRRPPDYRYRASLLLDMVGDADLQIYQERQSAGWRDSRFIVEGIWNTAARLGVHEFIPRRRHTIRDDHLMLHQIGRIPSAVLIDFDYVKPGTRQSYWHTREDTPDKCSALSLAKVGWVVLEWLRNPIPN